MARSPSTSWFLGLLVLDRFGGILPTTGSTPFTLIALTALVFGAAALVRVLRRRVARATS